MARKKIEDMLFAKVYPMLIAKAERKGRSKQEVNEITSWLTGYTEKELESFLNSELTYGEFFTQAPSLNPNRNLISGKICGVQIEEIEDELMREIRYLDKLIDELAKGRNMDKIKRS